MDTYILNLDWFDHFFGIGGQWMLPLCSAYHLANFLWFTIVFMPAYEIGLYIRIMYCFFHLFVRCFVFNEGNQQPLPTPIEIVCAKSRTTKEFKPLEPSMNPNEKLRAKTSIICFSYFFSRSSFLSSQTQVSYVLIALQYAKNRKNVRLWFK